MALGSFGDSFADAFNQSYKTFREARKDREERENNLAYGRDIAAAYGQHIASPAEEAAAMREGRTIQTPGMAQKLGLQKARPTDMAMAAPANFQAATPVTVAQSNTAASQANMPGQAIPTRAFPADMQRGNPMSAQAAPKAALPAPAAPAAPAAPGSPSAPAAPAQDDYITVSLKPATALKGEGRASLQIPKEFTDSKGVYVTSDQWEKLAIAALKQGKNTEGMAMFQKATDTKLAAVGTHMATLAANGDYKGLESFLNDIQDGSEAKIVPAPGGGYSFTYGEFKGQTFPSLDSIADFARKVAANDAPGIFQLFKEVASEKIAATIRAEESQVRQATIGKYKADTGKTEVETELLPAESASRISLNKSGEVQNYAAAGASNATAEATRIDSELAQRDGIPKEALAAEATANSEAQKAAAKAVSDGTIKPEEAAAFAGNQVAAFYNGTQYGRMIAARMAGSQAGGKAPAPGGIPTPNKPAAKPTPKVKDDTLGGDVSRVVGGVTSGIARNDAKQNAAQKARYTAKWKNEVNPLIQAYRKQVKSGTVSRTDLVKLRDKIKQFPASIVSQYTTPEDRAFFANN